MRQSAQTADAIPHDLAIDASGQIVVAGHFTQQLDLGGEPLQAEDASIDAFEHAWSRRLGGAGEQWAQAVAFDGDGNAHVGGRFEDELHRRPDGAAAIAGGFFGEADFGGGPVSSAGIFDGFLAVLAP